MTCVYSTCILPILITKKHFIRLTLYYLIVQWTNIGLFTKVASWWHYILASKHWTVLSARPPRSCVALGPFVCVPARGATLYCKIITHSTLLQKILLWKLYQSTKKGLEKRESKLFSESFQSSPWFRRVLKCPHPLTVIGRSLTVLGRPLTGRGHRLTVKGRPLNVWGCPLTMIVCPLTVRGRRLNIRGCPSDFDRTPCWLRDDNSECTEDASWMYEDAPDCGRTPPDWERTPPECTRTPPDCDKTPPDLERMPPEYTRTAPDCGRTPPVWERTPPDCDRMQMTGRGGLLNVWWRPLTLKGRPLIVRRHPLTGRGQYLASYHRKEVRPPYFGI